jgi:hypothetical protein
MTAGIRILIGAQSRSEAMRKRAALSGRAGEFSDETPMSLIKVSIWLKIDHFHTLIKPTRS